MSKHLLKSTAVVGFMTLISRVLGLARDMVIARFFPIGAGTDAFFVAFKIPNFLRRLFAEGSFSQAFVPVLSEYRATRSDDEVRRLADHVAGTLAGVLFLVTLAGVLAAPLLIVLFAPGFMDDQPKLMLAADMLRITFPYILFISLTSLASGVLNTYGRFAVPALTPVFLNLAMIGAAIWLAPLFDPPVLALAWGVFIGGVVQLLFQLPFLYRLRLLPRPRWGMADAGVRRILSLMGPSIFAVSVTQINLLINTVIASFLITGSVSWLYYSDRLVEFPLGVFGVALATVILPALSRKHAAAAPEEFSHTLDWALRWVALIGIPATLGLAMLSGPLLCALFQYGAFDSRDLEMSRLSLMAYSLGLLGFILVKVLVPGFYARQDTRTPVRVAVIALVSNLIMSMAFVMPMVRLDIPGPHAGLALATSLAAYINAVLLFRILQRQGIYQARPGWGMLLMRVALASLAMAVTLMLLVPDLSLWSHWSSGERIARLLIAVAGGMVVYVVALGLAGLRPAHLHAHSDTI